MFRMFKLFGLDLCWIVLKIVFSILIKLCTKFINCFIWFYCWAPSTEAALLFFHSFFVFSSAVSWGNGFDGFDVWVSMRTEGRFMVIHAPSLLIHITINYCCLNINTCSNHARKLLELFYHLNLALKYNTFSLFFRYHKTVKCSDSS